MTSHSEPSLQHPECIAQQPLADSSDVNLATQLSIVGYSSDSPISTPTRLLFTCQTNINNSNGNLLFPLAETVENTTKHSQKMSWHSLLKHLKSQRIVKNIEIFGKLKRKKQQHDRKTQQFPFEVKHRHKDSFPCESYKNIKRKELKNAKKVRFPLNVTSGKATFLYNGKGFGEKYENVSNAGNTKILPMDSKVKLNLKRTPNMKTPRIGVNLKGFPCIKELNYNVNKEFPSQNNANTLYSSNGKLLKFPQKLYPNLQSFPYENLSHKETNLKLNNFRQQFQIRQISNNTNTLRQSDQKIITKFPCEIFLKSQLAARFPVQDINNKSTQYEFNSLNNCLNNDNCSKINNSINPKTSSASSYSQSLSMTQNGQHFKNIDNEYVSQVQDAQVRAEENPPPPPPTTRAENKQPPPQTTLAKTQYDDADVYILAAINAINNTRPNEVGYYAEKIERIQDAIVVLFEKIQNSLATNHNSEPESTNAVKRDERDEGDARFALTPPTSVTSVRNTERTVNKYDLGDLCDRQVGQIVERSDVRETLAEAVDYGVTTEQTYSTGSFLAKSEEPTSPNSPAPIPLNESILYTSLEDYTNASELLPKYNVLAVNREINVDVKNKLESDPIETIDAQTKLNKFNELTSETQNTVTDSTRLINSTSEKVNEMTVTRLATDNEQENPNKNLQSNEALAQKNNILSNDLEIDEMKFEMNRVKGALPSSVSERALGKHEHLVTGASANSPYGRHAGTNLTRLSTETPSTNSRIPSSLSSARNYNDSSYTPRSALRNENKRSTINTHLPADAITNRSISNTPSISETISNRSALNSGKPSNDTGSDVLSSRRPSLGALRNTQSTSLLSVDLPRYTPLSTVHQTDPTNSIGRAVSIDSPLGDVLPERTRLRRQRRLRSQDSQDEPEDPIERLNRLKARISASLSEVKGVLKQYSTEAENDNENQTTAAANSLKDIKEEEKKDEGPVTFRFVKKVRRRSLFTEEEEKEQKEKEKNAELPKEKSENLLDKQLDSKDETDNIKSTIGSTLPTQSSDIIKEQVQQTLEKQVQNKIESNELVPPTNEVKLNTNLYTLKEEVQESFEEAKQIETKTEAKIVEQNEINRTTKDELQTLKEETKGAIPKPGIKHETKPWGNDATHEDTTKTKKKLIIKSKDPARRASLAAVEGSKIEPAVKVAIPAKIHRRPSDSEAVVKKKLITAKINTSGVVEEVTPKPKIVKVKRSSVRSKNNSQLATMQSKLREEDNAMTAVNDKSDDHVKPIDEDNKSIHTDKNKDVLLPKQPEQQQINTEITRQRNSLLPTQSVIDEAASLNVKTIENSVPPPRQQQQQQLEPSEQKQEKQATIKSTTTNFKSNDLQAAGVMLESVTTVLSSSTASEANGQIKRENVVPQDDLRDLLQQETTIIKPSAQTNKQNELNLPNQTVGNHQSKVKDLLLQQASTEKFKENLQNLKTVTAEQQQKPTETTTQEQVVATTDVVVAKSEDDNKKHDDIKVKTSLKEPCTDKTPTPTHDGAQHHQLLVAGEQSITTNVADTKTISSPHISISSASDITQKTTASSTDSASEELADVPATQQNTMPELQLAPAPVQTAEIISHPEHHKKKVILKKVIRQSSVDKTKKAELETAKPTEQVEHESEKVNDETPSEPAKDTSNEECSESTEISESSASIGSEEVAATEKPKKERKVKQRVFIKRQKRRLSIGDNFFHPGAEEEPQNTEIETLEKPISYVTDDEEEEATTDEPDEVDKNAQEQQVEEKKPLKSCIMHKEYHIGDEVLYAERFKKTQIKWRRGRIKERITSISYLLDIDGKDVSSHINYLKKFTGRKVSFGGKEYLEIDYEQLAEEEEKAERLQRRTYSIWNMV